MGTASPIKTQRWTQSFVGTLLLTLAGPIVWSMHFVVVYGAHTLICSHGASGDSAEFIIAVATLIALAVLALRVAWSPAVALGEDGRTRRFLRTTMLFLTLLSALGIIWAGSAVLFLPACLPMR